MEKMVITRGTTNTVDISIADATGAPYVLNANEKVVFGIKKDPNDKNVIFAKVAKTLGQGVFRVTLDPEDTQNLDVGWYYCDAGVDDGVNFFNAVKATLFELSMNVTYRGCAD